MRRVLIYHEITNEDTARMRRALKEAGIKASVRKGRGSTRYNLYVRVKPGTRVSPERIIQIGRHLGYQPQKAWRATWGWNRTIPFIRAIERSL
jgi:hypothetical protein